MTLQSETQSKDIPVDFDPFAAGEISFTAPATESQKEIWASVQMGDEANCAYNESQTLRLKGKLHVEALETALQQLVDRHESLRTTLSSDGETLCIADSLNIEIPFIDLSGLDNQSSQDGINKLQKQAVETPFDVEYGPLFRAELIQVSIEEYLVLLTAHHIICDGWSWAVMMPDLGNLYSAIQEGKMPELDDPERFSDYAIALESESDGEEATETLEYWLNQFADSVPILDFPTDYPRPPLRTFDSAREDWELPETLITQLKQLGTDLGCSFMTTMLSGFEVFMHRLTGQEDVIVGVPAAGQANSGNYNLVGHCINLLPMRTYIDGQLSFSTYLKSRKSTVLDAYEYQQFTFGSLIQKLSIARDSSRIPLVPILFNIDKALDLNELKFDGLEINFSSNARAYENFEIFINATEDNGKVTLECQYNTNLFEVETIRRRLAELQAVLEGAVANPDQSIATLTLLTGVEQQQSLVDWNQTQTDYPQDKTVCQLFEEQVERTPEAIALIFEGSKFTYRELNERANQLAHYLQTLGVKPETFVGICIERSLEMMVALLGVLKAGGAYIPLDPAYPQERLAYMLADSQLKVLLTQDIIVPYLPPNQAQIIRLDADWSDIASQNTTNPTRTINLDELAYVIYTSGSTGKPKGVLIPHRGLTNFLLAMQQNFGLTSQDRLLAVTTISFDIAALELYLPLITGAQVVLASREVAADGDQLKALLSETATTIMQATPATWYMLLTTDWQPSNAIKILCGGEALPRELADQLLPLSQELWNLYGPTETTIWSAACQIKADKQPITIGYPIANTELYILDKNLQPTPIGIAGELHIGGAGISRGYLNRPDLTAEKFIANPLSSDPNIRIYKTGDLARWLPNGQMECLGRIDYQVKVRGFRIELGEIEANMLQYPLIKKAVVIVREDTPGDKMLVGYFVPASGKAEESYEQISELRQFLRSSLPDYMVPSRFMPLDVLPLTPNGKTDRKALPIPDTLQQLAAGYVAPTTELEQQIVDIWAQVFELERVGINDNFFELGGHSLLAIKVVSRLRKELHVEILLPALFELPTVADLAQRVETLRWVAQGEQAVQDDLDGDYEEGEL